MPSKYLAAAALPFTFWSLGSAIMLEQYAESTVTLDRGPVVERPVAKGSPQWLMDKHHCWTANGPVGVIPGHAVVLRSDALTARYVGGAAASKALEQAINGGSTFEHIYGFCR